MNRQRPVAAHLVASLAIACVMLAGCHPAPARMDPGTAQDVAVSIQGRIDFVADWETGDWSPFPQVACKPEQFAAVTRPVRQGVYSARFTVRPGDKWGGYSGERCELAREYREFEGDEYYYGWSTLFPADWTAPAYYGIILQWHSPAPISPPIAISASGSELEVQVETGDIDGGAGEYRQNTTVLNSLELGTWHDFIIHIKFQSRYTGFIELWHRLEGDADFSLIYSQRNIPTLQRSAAEPGAYERAYIQHGFYRGDGGSNTNVVYQDNLRRGTTYDVVRAAFP